MVSLLLIASLLLIPILNSAKVFASSKKIDKILFIIENQEDYNNILTISEENEIESTFDICLIEDWHKINMSSYSAVALPYTDNIDYGEIKSAYKSGTLIYLYGNLSINDYKAAVGVDDFSLEIEMKDVSEKSNPTVKQYFDEEYEINEIFNVISFGTKSLLGKIADETILTATYFQIIVQNFQKLLFGI